MKKTICLLFAVFICMQVVSFGASYKVLSRIETYKAPPFPAVTYLTNDLYEENIKNNQTVPPSLTETFIYDIWQRIDLDNAYAWSDKPATPADVDISDILAAFQVYQDKVYTKIAGYRPWTHWNFIRDLNNRERYELAKDVVKHMHARGVWSESK